MVATLRCQVQPPAMFVTLHVYDFRVRETRAARRRNAKTGQAQTGSIWSQTAAKAAMRADLPRRKHCYDEDEEFRCTSNADSFPDGQRHMAQPF